MRRCGLYRHYGADGELLYVGISVNPFSRFSQHGGQGKAMHQVSRMEVEWHETEADARQAEWVAIGNERPAWNKQRPNPYLQKIMPKMNKTPWRSFAVGNVPCGVYDFFFDESEIERAAKVAREGDTMQIGLDRFVIPHGHNSMRYVLDRASELTGMDVKAHHLKRRYGNRWAADTKETDRG